MPVQEKKVDPSDGKCYTLEGLSMFYKGHFSRKQIETYWMDKCLPMKQAEKAERRVDQTDGKEYTFDQLLCRTGFDMKVVRQYWDKWCIPVAQYQEKKEKAYPNAAPSCTSLRTPTHEKRCQFASNALNRKDVLIAAASTPQASPTKTPTKTGQLRALKYRPVEEVRTEEFAEVPAAAPNVDEQAVSTVSESSFRAKPQVVALDLDDCSPEIKSESTEPAEVQQEQEFQDEHSEFGEDNDEDDEDENVRREIPMSFAIDFPLSNQEKRFRLLMLQDQERVAALQMCNQMETRARRTSHCGTISGAHVRQLMSPDKQALSDDESDGSGSDVDVELLEKQRQLEQQLQDVREAQRQRRARRASIA